MIEVLNNSLNPYFNVACEEYILKNFSQDCFILWQNLPSLIVGKHQNTLAEINQKFVSKNNLHVVRRISGGGTVYHDLGNLNFTFITNHNSDKIINFAYYTKPIIELLAELGIIATLNSRNNIFIGDKKITGTAAHIFKNRVIHHGTLLFSTSIPDLEASISGNVNAYNDKAIKSIRNNVTNIYNHLSNKISVEIFRELLRNKINKYFNIEHKQKLTDQDISKINELVKSKHQTWEWNYGYSPAYHFTKSLHDNSLIVELDVKKGIIEKITFSGNHFEDNNMRNLEVLLVGKHHNKVTIENVLINSGISFAKIALADLLEIIF